MRLRSIYSALRCAGDAQHARMVRAAFRRLIEIAYKSNRARGAEVLADFRERLGKRPSSSLTVLVAQDLTDAVVRETDP